MTYAEKLALEYAEIINKKRRMDTWELKQILKEQVNKAMQAQREACERNVTNRMSLSLKFNYDEKKVLIAILQTEILNAEVQP